MSSWFPNTVAHGIPLPLVREIALSQYKLALGIGRLFAVTRSPRYTTKSGFSTSRMAAMTRSEPASCAGPQSVHASSP
uniref:Uncharacterized protein n=1 Tax=Arundo donax TaxID=35708 RepID=A0A0A9F014_ARUDO